MFLLILVECRHYRYFAVHGAYMLNIRVTHVCLQPAAFRTPGLTHRVAPLPPAQPGGTSVSTKVSAWRTFVCARTAWDHRVRHVQLTVTRCASAVALVSS